MGRFLLKRNVTIIRPQFLPFIFPFLKISSENFVNIDDDVVRLEFFFFVAPGLLLKKKRNFHDDVCQKIHTVQ
jgi:hypothetical protein